MTADQLDIARTARDEISNATMPGLTWQERRAARERANREMAQLSESSQVMMHEYMRNMELAMTALQMKMNDAAQAHLEMAGAIFALVANNAKLARKEG